MPEFEDPIAGPRQLSVKSWINQSPQLAGRVQRAEVLDSLLGAKPTDHSAALDMLSRPVARAAQARHNVRETYPVKSEALAHFFGGFSADEQSDLLSRFKSGIKDLNYAKKISPAVRKDFHKRLAQVGFLGAASVLAAKLLKKHQLNKQAEAAMSQMELRQLVRRLKLLRGTRGGSRLLRILEARYAALDKEKQGKKKKKKGKRR